MWQFVPIAFQARPLPRHVLYWHLPLHTLSVLLMVFGFLANRFDIVAYGGLSLLLVTLAYGFLVFAALRQARNRTAVWEQVGWPLFILPIVMILGIVLAFGTINGSNQWLTTHGGIGLLGFWMLMVIILSYKFFPMFALSHGYEVSAKRVVRIYVLGLLLLLSGIWLHDASHGWRPVLTLSGFLGGCLMLVALLLFTRDSSRILKARKRKRLAPSLIAALVSTAVLLVATTAAIVAMCLQMGTWSVAITYVMLFGGLVPLFIAYLHKIVPFLRFEYRYSYASDRKTAPALDDMVQRIPFVWGMSIYASASLLGLFTLLLDHAAEGYGWEILIGVAQAIGLLLVSLGLLHILRIGGARPM
ncbi:hypothetical protein [Sulfoacidibacillus ferrooxidans]|uniref:hypothetical protein n=1 Tax=Sulfoacidibacillus ferrooxidans TaxID=2005001 RepID=UPI001F513B2D|nr:hypothetical protein [Sulfoacidibacillus ferrooxidans]